MEISHGNNGILSRISVDFIYVKCLMPRCTYKSFIDNILFLIDISLVCLDFIFTVFSYFNKSDSM